MIRKSFLKWIAAAALAIPVVPALAVTKPAAKTAPKVVHHAAAAKKGGKKVVHHRAPRHHSKVSKTHRAIHRKAVAHAGKKTTHHAPITKTAVASRWAAPVVEMPVNRVAARTGGTPVVAAAAPKKSGTVTLSNRNTVPSNR